MSRSSRLSKSLKRKLELGQKAFIPFITPGFPNLKATTKLLDEFIKLKVDAIEIGMPFSDPMADGPTIQKASEVALKNGVHLDAVLKLVKEFRKHSEIPILLMGYYNPILQYGLDRFVKTAEQSGVDGLLIVDLPVEESKPLRQILRGKAMDLIFLLTPTSTAERIDLVARYGSGFVYYVSYTGITGSKKANLNEVKQQIERIRQKIKLPINIGFGIATPQDAKRLSQLADGIVVGSALIQKLQAKSIQPAATLAKQMIKQLR